MNVIDTCLWHSGRTYVANVTQRKMDMYLKVSGVIVKRVKVVMRKLCLKLKHLADVKYHSTASCDSFGNWSGFNFNLTHCG